MWANWSASSAFRATLTAWRPTAPERFPSGNSIRCLPQAAPLSTRSAAAQCRTASNGTRPDLIRSPQMPSCKSSPTPTLTQPTAISFRFSIATIGFLGGSVGDRFEPGAGNDRVTGGDGDDIVFKWKHGNLNFDGGAGHDILSFATDGTSEPFPSTSVETLRIDLAQGAGRSPWGGKLVLTSVEEVSDTDGRDVILGSGRGDTVQSDFGGGDVAEAARRRRYGAHFRAGRGADLRRRRGAGRAGDLAGLRGQRPRPRRPARNAGNFAGARLSGVEVISASSIWAGSTFRLTGTAAAET